MKYIFVLVEFKHTEVFTSYGGYLLLNTKVPSVGFSLAGLDRAKFGFYQFQIFLFFCCHSNIEFTKTYILTNFNLRSITGENVRGITQG